MLFQLSRGFQEPNHNVNGGVGVYIAPFVHIHGRFYGLDRIRSSTGFCAYINRGNARFGNGRH